MSLCVAVDQAGNAITTTDPTGGSGAWTSAYLKDTSPTYGCIHYGDLGGSCGQASLSDVSCPSVHLCVALDQAGNVITSTNPTGDASSWNVVFAEIPDSPSGLSQISCTSASFCYGTDRWGNFVASPDPARSGSWTATGVGPGDRPAWSSPDPGFAGIVSSVSCRFSTLCVGRNGYEQLIATRDPTTAAPTWRVVLDRGTISVARASVAWCFAWDTHGNLFSSENPAAGSNAWGRARPDRTRSPTTFSCPSATLCLELDTNGNVRVGQPTPSRAKIGAALIHTLRSAGNHATLGALLSHHGYEFSFTAPTGGTFTTSWYLARRRVCRSRILVAVGHASFANTETSHIVLKLTRDGRALLGHARHAKLTALGRFIPTGAPPITAANTFSIGR